jgi:hypothetical protein
MRTPRLPAVDWTDAPADLDGLVRSGGRQNLVSARAPPGFERALPHIVTTDLLCDKSQYSPADAIQLDTILYKDVVLYFLF